MKVKELNALANMLLNQNGYDQNGSKNTEEQRKQNAFEKKIIKMPM